MSPSCCSIQLLLRFNYILFVVVYGPRIMRIADDFGVFAFVASAFVRAFLACLFTITVAFLTLWFFTSTKYSFDHLIVLTFLNLFQKDFSVRVAFVVFAFFTLAILSAVSSIFKTLTVEFKTLCRFAVTGDTVTFFWSFTKGLIVGSRYTEITWF